MPSASETTSRRRQRVLFANKNIQQTALKNGLTSHIVLEGVRPGLGATSYTPYHSWLVGATVTTQEELDNCIASVPGGSPLVTVPSRPIITSVTGGNGKATIAFTASDGGSTITGYKVISNPATTIVTGSSSPIIFTGLTNGIAYTFTVIATNSVGDSQASLTSSPITPVAPAQRSYGTAKLATSFYDNADLGHTSLYGNFQKIATDAVGNTIVAGYYRSGTLTINRPDEDGISQTETLTETFSGPTSFTQGNNTYYANNLYITKYSSSAVPVWAAKISGTTNQGMIVYSVTCDSQNNVYALVAASGSVATANNVTFYNENGTEFGSKSNVFGFGNFTPARYFLIKYNAAGIIQWVNSITAGDNNSQFVLLRFGHLAIDNLDNVYISTHIQRAGGGTGPTTMSFYSYSGVLEGVIQDTFVTADRYAFGGNPQENQRSHLIKLSSSGSYTWIARMSNPTAYGENNGGGMNGNIVIDRENNVYVCQNSAGSASSPICNIYSGVPATNPLAALAAPYYRLDLRGNSISPSLPQHYQYVAILKFNSDGVFQRACCSYQVKNSSVALNMSGFLGINKATNELYMSLNAQGFAGTNAMSGAQLNALYINSFSQNATNGSNYDIQVSNTLNVPLRQPQSIVAIVKFNSDLQAQRVAYIDTPGNLSQFNVDPVPNHLSLDSSGNIYITTTIKDTYDMKTIYTFDTINDSTATFNTFATISATNSNADGLVVSYSGDLAGRWANRIVSSDGLNDDGFACGVNSDDYIFVCGNAVVNKNAVSNSIAITSYDSIAEGSVQNTLFGNLNVTTAVDRVGFLIKYE